MYNIKSTHVGRKKQCGLIVHHNKVNFTSIYVVATETTL